MGNDIEALKDFSHVLELDSSNIDAFYNTANVMLTKNEYEEELKYYDRALELDPEHAEAWYGRGNVLEAMDEGEAAAACFRKATQMGFVQGDEEQAPL